MGSWLVLSSSPDPYFCSFQQIHLYQLGISCLDSFWIELLLKVVHYFGQESFEWQVRTPSAKQNGDALSSGCRSNLSHACHIRLPKNGWGLDDGLRLKTSGPKKTKLKKHNFCYLWVEFVCLSGGDMSQCFLHWPCRNRVSHRACQACGGGW